MTTLVIPTEAPAVPGPPQGQWTYADWERLPDDGKPNDGKLGDAGAREDGGSDVGKLDEEMLEGHTPVVAGAGAEPNA